jgi:hypothetical protein
MLGLMCFVLSAIFSMPHDSVRVAIASLRFLFLIFDIHYLFAVLGPLSIRTSALNGAATALWLPLALFFPG